MFKLIERMWGWVSRRRDAAVHADLGFVVDLFDPIVRKLESHAAAAKQRAAEHDRLLTQKL